MSTKWKCNMCGGKPCVLEVPDGVPEVCPFPEEGIGAEYADWQKVKDRRRKNDGN